MRDFLACELYSLKADFHQLLLLADFGQLVAALRGTSAAAGVPMGWNETLKEKQQARSSALYFLWEAGVH